MKITNVNALAAFFIFSTLPQHIYSILMDYLFCSVDAFLIKLICYSFLTGSLSWDFVTFFICSSVFIY